MLGNSSDLTSAAGEGTAGLIPRICVELFQRFGLASGGSGGAEENIHRGHGRASVQVSFCEVSYFAGRVLCVSAAGGFPPLTVTFDSTSPLLQASCSFKMGRGVDPIQVQ